MVTGVDHGRGLFGRLTAVEAFLFREWFLPRWKPVRGASHHMTSPGSFSAKISLKARFSRICSGKPQNPRLEDADFAVF